MVTGVLTDELLARAERIYRTTRDEGGTRLSRYDEGGGSSSDFEQGHSAEGKKKWLT